jgi:hypothetical protein
VRDWSLTDTWIPGHDRVMNGWESLRRFLHADAADVGCGGTFRLLAAYVDRELESAAAETDYPGVAAHLRVCAPCAEDFRGLLATAGIAGLEVR